MRREDFCRFGLLENVKVLTSSARSLVTERRDMVPLEGSSGTPNRGPRVLLVMRNKIVESSTVSTISSDCVNLCPPG